MTLDYRILLRNDDRHATDFHYFESIVERKSNIMQIWNITSFYNGNHLFRVDQSSQTK